MSRLVAIVTLTVVAGVGGCSVLYSPSIDEFASGSDGGEGGASSSSSSGSSSGSTSSSGGEGGVRDGGKLPDGGDPPFVCPAGALLCDDFEHDAVTAKFAQQFGTVATTTRQAKSPSRSLSALLRGNDPNPSVASILEVSPKATVSFWFRTPTSVPSDDITFRLADFLWGDGCDWELSWTLDLRADGLHTGISTYDQATNPSCGPTDFAGDALLSATQTFVPAWHQIVVKLDVTTQKRRVEVFLDGVGPVVEEVDSVRSTVPTEARLSIGVPCIQQGGGCFEWEGGDLEMFFDDVIVEAK